jgi:hypothetical protein
VKRLKDVDAFDRSMLLKLGIPTYLLATFLESVVGYRGLRYVLIINPLITAAVVGIWWLIIEGIGRATGTLWMPTGTPPGRQYSEQDALIVRGLIPEALNSYRTHLLDNPADLDARLRLASLLAGEGRDPAAAECCFLEIRTLQPSADQDRVVTNGLIDLYRAVDRRDMLKTELARFAYQYRDGAAGESARRYLRKLTHEDGGAGRATTDRTPPV